MKKQVKRIPSLPTDREAATYWDTHSFAEHAQETTDAGIRFVRRPKRAISLRLDPEDIAKIEAMAEAKDKKKELKTNYTNSPKNNT